MHTQPTATTITPPARAPEDVLNAFTVDVEDYFHVTAFTKTVSRASWGDYESRVVANTRRILRLLDEHGVRATFFVLGWVAERFPRLVHDIQVAGHEIGCHSYAHRPIFEQTPDEFREDLLQATKILEEITGQPVRAFRAPSFSITERSQWALDVLIEEGYTHDSSIFPIRHDVYGMPHAERFVHSVTRRDGTLCEFPPSAYRWAGMNIPVAGGGYFRLLPVEFSVRCLRSINIRNEQPCMFYIHPWELDPDQPRLPGPWKSRLRHYQNLHTTEGKLRQLLCSLPFGSMGQALAAARRGSAGTTAAVNRPHHEASAASAG